MIGQINGRRAVVIDLIYRTAGAAPVGARCEYAFNGSSYFGKKEPICNLCCIVQSHKLNPAIKRHPGRTGRDRKYGYVRASIVRK